MWPLHDLWKLARGGSPVLCEEMRLLIWLTSCSRTSCWSLVSTWHTSSRKNTVETADAFTGMAEVESAYVRCSFLLLVEVRAARARNPLNNFTLWLGDRVYIYVEPQETGAFTKAGACVSTNHSLAPWPRSTCAAEGFSLMRVKEEPPPPHPSRRSMNLKTKRDK